MSILRRNACLLGGSSLELYTCPRMLKYWDPPSPPTFLCDWPLRVAIIRPTTIGVDYCGFLEETFTLQGIRGISKSIRHFIRHSTTSQRWPVPVGPQVFVIAEIWICWFGRFVFVFHICRQVIHINTCFGFLGSRGSRLGNDKYLRAYWYIFDKWLSDG